MQQLVCELVDNLVRQSETYRKILAVSQTQTDIVQGEQFPAVMDTFWEQMTLQKDHLIRLEEWRVSGSQMENRLAQQLDLPEIRLSLLRERVTEEEYQSMVEAIAELSQVIEDVTRSYERLETVMREKIRNIGRELRNGAISPGSVKNAYKSNQTPPSYSTKSDKS
ncbi:MAG: hypothetical protein ACM3QZ_02290 [Solirubrobacterales bacterium]